MFCHLSDTYVIRVVLPIVTTWNTYHVAGTAPTKRNRALNSADKNDTALQAHYAYSMSISDT